MRAQFALSNCPPPPKIPPLTSIMPEAESPTGTTTAPQPYSRKNPYLTELIRHERLTQAGSEKDTRHFVLSLGDSRMKYTPGDSIGAFARNAPPLVDELISLLRFSPEMPVTNPHGENKSLLLSVLEDYILNRANRKIMSGMAERIPQGEQRNRLMEIVDNADELNAYIYSRDYVDILKEFDE